MIILGIDPGLATVGYGVIEYDFRTMKLIDYGTLITAAGLKLPERLDMLYEGMGELIDKFKPDSIAFEELFFNNNTKTAIAVAEARGVLVLAAYKKNQALYEYTPLQVKQGVTGYGRADKNQVQQMVKTLLNLKQVPKPDDAADAVAIAITHASSINFKNAFSI